VQEKGIARMVVVGILTVAIMVVPAAFWGQGGGNVLTPAELQKLVPASVFYRGQTASTQLRNSGGVKFADGFYVLASLVDTGGYTTAVVAQYQGQLITEVPIKVGGKDLPAGVYGIGFIANDQFVVTDVGAHGVLTVNSATDAGLKRPRPLQVLADSSGGFRLYEGRRYVVLSR
jgi:hypothetical protein